MTEFNDVLIARLPPGLPPKRAIDHKINILPGSTPPAKVPYKLNATQLAELKKQLIELETSGFIYSRNLPYGTLNKITRWTNADVHGLSSTQQDNNRR